MREQRPDRPAEEDCLELRLSCSMELRRRFSPVQQTLADKSEIARFAANALFLNGSPHKDRWLYDNAIRSEQRPSLPFSS